MNSAFVYLVRLNGEPKYVGFTSTSVTKRWKKHCADAASGSTSVFHAAIRKYGPKSFIVEVIHQTEDAEYALKVIEPKFIMEYKTRLCDGGYNMTDGGEGAVGVFVSEETRKKRSDSLKGRVFSEDTRRKISEAKRGVRRSDDAKKKISEGHKNSEKAKAHVAKMCESWIGKTHSETTKQKLSAIHKGRVCSDETKKKISDSHKKRLLKPEE